MEGTKVQVQIARVPVDLLKRAQELAARNDRSLSSIVRELLRGWIDEQEKIGELHVHARARN